MTVGSLGKTKQSQPTAMLDLINKALSISTDLGQLQPTLDSFCSEFDAAAASVFSIHSFEEAKAHVSWSLSTEKFLPPEVIDQVRSGGDSGDAAAYRILLSKPAQNLYDEVKDTFECQSVDDLPPSDLRAACIRHGLVRRAAGVLNPSGPWADGFFVQTSSDAQAERLRADNRTSMFMPILANGITLGRVFTQMRARYNAALSVLDMLGLGVFLIDKTGCVIEQNNEADRILSLDDGLSLGHDKRLRTLTPDGTVKLTKLVKDALGLMHTGDGKPAQAMSIVRPSGEYDLLASVRAMEDGTGELEKALKSAFVLVIDPTNVNRLNADGLIQLADLSEAEAAVAQFLVQGLKLSEIAEQRDVSVNTIRTQLQALTTKLRCTSQSDVIRVAAATRLPLKK